MHPSPDNIVLDNLEYVVTQIIAAGAQPVYVFGATPTFLSNYKYPCEIDDTACENTIDPKTNKLNKKNKPAPWLNSGYSTDPSNPGWKSASGMPNDLTQWELFVRKVAVTFKGRIAAYEIWNEPQLAFFLYDFDNYSKSNTLGTLARMSASALSIIKVADPSALVLSASILPRASSGGVARAKKFLVELKNVKFQPHAYAVHLYPKSGERSAHGGGLQPAGAVGTGGVGELLEETKRVLFDDMKFDSSKPIWITEINFDLNSAVLPNDQNTRKAIRCTYMEAANQGIYSVMWYAMNTASSIKGLDIQTGNAAMGFISEAKTLMNGNWKSVYKSECPQPAKLSPEIQAKKIKSKPSSKALPGGKQSKLKKPAMATKKPTTKKKPARATKVAKKLVALKDGIVKKRGGGAAKRKKNASRPTRI